MEDWKYFWAVLLHSHEPSHSVTAQEDIGLLYKGRVVSDWDAE